MKNINSPSVEDIESLGLSIIEEAGENYNPSPKHRIAAFTELPGLREWLIELCPYSP